MIKKTSIFLLFGLILLVPASLLAVPAQATVQGAAALFVSGPDGLTKSMELKATKDTEGVKPVEDFQLSVDNVVSTPLNGEITVFADVGVQFTGAKLTPAANPQNTIDVPIVGGQISFDGMYSGVYTLDVIIGNNAYECIVVVGQSPQQAIINEITEINSQSSNVVKVFEKGKVKKVVDKEETCRFTPNHPICAPDPETGECDEDFNMNEDGQCFPDEPCPSGYHRANDDETGACISEDDLEQCPDGSWQHPGDTCFGQLATPTPTPEPEPITCEDGFILENGVCTETSSNCGGEPCTPSQKEDSTTSDVIPGEPHTPTTEPEVTESEETVQEIDEQEEQDEGEDDEQPEQ